MSENGKVAKLKDLQPDNRNANKGTARGQKQIVGSIQRNGFGRSGLLDKGGRIIAGNKTAEASAEVFGVETEVIIVESDGTKPVYVKRVDLDLDDPNPNNPARRLAYEDNVSSWLSFELDPEVVSLDMKGGFDFEGLGVSLEELGEMLEGGVQELLKGNGSSKLQEVEPELDRAEELKIKWGTALNQIWQCGNHRIMCGDCRDIESVKKLTQGELISLFVTDPPYGVSYGDKNRHLSEYDKSRRILTDIEGDQAKGGIKEVAETVWRPAFANMFEVAKPGCSYYMTAPQGGDQMMMMMMMMSEKWLVKHELIWVKDQMVFGRADYHYQHEPIIYGWKPGAGHFFVDDRTQVSVWNIPRPKASKDHPTEKPVQLYAKAIGNSSRKGEIVGDFFLGSGTALDACEQLGRKCLGMELTPGYTAVALERWHQLTSLIPQRVSG